MHLRPRKRLINLRQNSVNDSKSGLMDLFPRIPSPDECDIHNLKGMPVESRVLRTILLTDALELSEMLR